MINHTSICTLLNNSCMAFIPSLSRISQSVIITSERIGEQVLAISSEVQVHMLDQIWDGWLHGMLQWHGNKQFIGDFDLIMSILCRQQEKWQKYQAPNISAFDGALNRSPLSQPHVCTGPTSAPTSALSTSTDQAIQFMTAFFAAQARNSSLVSHSYYHWCCTHFSYCLSDSSTAL